MTKKVSKDGESALPHRQAIRDNRKSGRGASRLDAVERVRLRSEEKAIFGRWRTGHG